MQTKLATFYCYKVIYKGVVNKGPRVGAKQDTQSGREGVGEGTFELGLEG